MDTIETNIIVKCNQFIKNDQTITTDKYIYFNVHKLSGNSMEIRCPYALPLGIFLKFSLFLPDMVSMEILCKIDSSHIYIDGKQYYNCSIVASNSLNYSILKDYINTQLNKAI